MDGTSAFFALRNFPLDRSCLSLSCLGRHRTLNVAFRVVKIECVDWTGGQIKNNDSADDVKNVDLTKVHYLSGPFDVENAEPGDAVELEILDIQPMQEQPWGFTGVFAKENGGGFLDELYPNA